MKSKKSKYSSFLMGILILFLLFILSFFYYKQELKPVSNEPNVVEFNVLANSSVNSIITEMANENIIRNSLIAKVYLKLNNASYSIKEGTYEIDTSNDLDTILNYISDGSNAKVDSVRITFVEGDWLKDIVKKIADNTNLTDSELMDYITNEDNIKQYIEDYDFLTDDILNPDIRYALEGYLAPNTYDFYYDTTCDVAIRTLLDQTEKVYLSKKDEFAQSKYSINQIFTLASIVQYEASKVADMKLIAGVFYNRLDINMALQSSVTVCYAINIEQDGDWKDCETNPTFDSKYNTYLYSGLTPGPILNPGVDAIEAVLNPTKSDYYYFMADVYGDGTVYYAKTYDEHVNNVNKYLK